MNPRAPECIALASLLPPVVRGVLKGKCGEREGGKVEEQKVRNVIGKGRL